MSSPLISSGPLLSLQWGGNEFVIASLVNESVGLVCESVVKADMLSDHVDSKQSREAVDLPLTCHPSPVLPPLPSG